MVCNYRKTFGQPMISTPESYSELNTELRWAIIKDINFEMREANNRQTAPKLVLHFQEEEGYPIVYLDDNYPDDAEVVWVDRIVLNNNREEIRKEIWSLSNDSKNLSWGYIKDKISTDALIAILTELHRLNNHPISKEAFLVVLNNKEKVHKEIWSLSETNND